MAAAQDVPVPRVFRPKRGKPFTEQERLLLYQCMLPDLEIIDRRCMDSVTIVGKAEAWRRVTMKFNSNPSVYKRTTEQLKKCFENSKCRKQWVALTPSSGLSGQNLQDAVLMGSSGRSPRTTTLEDIFTNRNGDTEPLGQELIGNLTLYGDLHPALEQRLDNIKCELVDIADDNSQDDQRKEMDPLVIPAEAEPKEPHYRTDQANVYTEDQNLEEDADHDGDAVCDNLDDVNGGFYADSSVYPEDFPRQHSLTSRRKRRRLESAEANLEETSNDHLVNNAGKNPEVQALELRLLQAQVREAELAASAAATQLQLNRLALRHAEAEELRRQELHNLRLRRLALCTDTGT